MKEAVIVKWIDAQRVEVGGVHSEEEIKNLEPLPCEMIGFKIFEDEEKIILAQEWWEETSQIKYANIIPKVSILKITYLEEVIEPKLDRDHNKCICGNIKFKTSKRCKECAAKNKYGKLSYHKDD